ncbi:hypothetical protein [Streptomyces sp. NPDC005017]|uniref:hypothetical protein n=1 Tax=Streptomyces sp. NPDC005017 TaxID=3364706 RepID=UPI00367A82F3
MKKTTFGRVTAAALTTAVLLATAACGGDESAAGDEGPAPLTETQLLAAALAEGDIGAYTSEEPYGEDGPLSDTYTARPEVCQPLVGLAEGATPHDAAAEVARDVSDPNAEPAVDIDLRLRSYTAEDATAVMKAFGEAGEKCADGFTEDRALAEAKVLRVETLEAPALGDEALAFRITMQDVKDDSLKLYEYLTVIRSGTTTLSFRAEPVGTEDFGGVPQDVVDAQWEKFRRTTP